MAVRIGIAGISGRMGRLLVEEVGPAGAVLAGGVRRPGGAPLPNVALLPDIAALARNCDVVIDFTHASAVALHSAALAAAGCAWVLGTSGIGPLEQRAATAAAQHIAVLQAANFSFGVNLMLALAERMAAVLPAEQYDAEILEMHHRQKVDAPSGTAIALGWAVARGRGTTLDQVMQSGRHGDVGPRKTGEIGFAALRGGQVVGEHALIFAGKSEHLTLSHRAFDRRVYATGAVQAALWLASRPAGLYTMRDVLGLPAR